jgi:hypothetical protein
MRFLSPKSKVRLTPAFIVSYGIWRSESNGVQPSRTDSVMVAVVVDVAEDVAGGEGHHGTTSVTHIALHPKANTRS